MICKIKKDPVLQHTAPDDRIGYHTDNHRIFHKQHPRCYLEEASQKPQINGFVDDIDQRA
jgi:hypothetical protein